MRVCSPPSGGSPARERRTWSPMGHRTWCSLTVPSAPRGLLQVLETGCGLLTAMVRTASPQVRAFHAYGVSGPEGFAAMGVVETLVHTHELAAGLALRWAPPVAAAVEVWPGYSDGVGDHHRGGAGPVLRQAAARCASSPGAPGTGTQRGSAGPGPGPDGRRSRAGPAVSALHGLPRAGSGRARGGAPSGWASSSTGRR